jgi:serine/threonine-protein kinase RsbW
MTAYSATFDNLGRITNQVVEAARVAGLSEKSIYEVEVAIDEACTNIIEHSYGEQGHGEIDCICQILPDGLKIILRDSGCYFNPDRIPSPDLISPLSKRKPRGLGLFFMRKLMDEVKFDPCEGQGTLLTMVKRKERTP